MNTKRTTLVLAALICLVSPLAASAITVDTVPVGNPGNANDPATGSLYGGVAYNYSIGKYDVTVGQYTAFLNAVAATDTYALYNPAMATDLNIAGIARSGSSGSYTYSVIGSANHPITYVSWGDAARFSNWLNNGQPTGLENASTTEAGAYTLNGAIKNAALNAVTRNAGAQWFIPTGKRVVQGGLLRSGGGALLELCDRHEHDADLSARRQHTEHSEFLWRHHRHICRNRFDELRFQPKLFDRRGSLHGLGEPLRYVRPGRGCVSVERSVNQRLGSGRRRGFVVRHLGQPAVRRSGGFNPSDGYNSIGFRVATVPEPSSAVLAALGWLGTVWRRRTRRSFSLK